jgi:hypothetical protein
VMAPKHMNEQQRDKGKWAPLKHCGLVSTAKHVGSSGGARGSAVQQRSRCTLPHHPHVDITPPHTQRENFFQRNYKKQRGSERGSCLV